jgi:hypothetical protein
MGKIEKKAEEYLKNKQKGGDHIVATKPEAIYALGDFANKMIIENNLLIGADIRNKLSPIKNLCALLEDKEHVDIFCSSDNLKNIIKSEIENIKGIVQYLSNIEDNIKKIE